MFEMPNLRLHVVNVCFAISCTCIYWQGFASRSLHTDEWQQEFVLVHWTEHVESFCAEHSELFAVAPIQFAGIVRWRIPLQLPQLVSQNRSEDGDPLQFQQTIGWAQANWCQNPNWCPKSNPVPLGNCANWAWNNLPGSLVVRTTHGVTHRW